MAYFPVKLPPGVVRYGTEGGSAGRYYDAYLIRWNDDGTLKPIGGWRSRISDTAPGDTITGASRCLFAWKTNSSITWLGIGTHSNWYVQSRGGTSYDITPVSFSSGRADAVAGGGYGQGTFGSGTYGTPRPDDTLVQMATQATFDNWGEFLVGVSPDDGIINQWDPADTGTPAGPITGGDTPPTCKALVVTQERFLFALGADNNPRLVKWCDQEDNTTWTPDATNQAGSFELQTAGTLMCGKVVKGGVLLFTDLDVHIAEWKGGTLVFSFDKLASSCGILSRQAVAAFDSQAVWMSKGAFWLYNGYVQQLQCDVQDYVFSDFNLLQSSKTYAVRDSENSEIQFYYCSSGSSEIDRCVIWNYKNNYWNIGRAPRLCGTDRGVFSYPIYVDSSNDVLEHEVGFDYDGDEPYAEGGPIEIGNGDNVVHVNRVVPDEKTSGQAEVTFYIKDYPNGSGTAYGPYTLDEKVDVRFTGRRVRIRYTGAVLADWRVGTVKLDGKLGGTR